MMNGWNSMKYFRTKDSIDCFATKHEHYLQDPQCIQDYGIIKFSEKIELLIDRFVVVNKSNNVKRSYSYESFVERVKRNRTDDYEHDTYLDRLKKLLEHNIIYGAIWVEVEKNIWGLKPVTKPMNDDGKLELL